MLDCLRKAVNNVAKGFQGGTESNHWACEVDVIAQLTYKAEGGPEKLAVNIAKSACRVELIAAMFDNALT